MINDPETAATAPVARRPLNAVSWLGVILAAALAGSPATAREVTITTTMGSAHRGVGAYIIVYLTDADRKEYRGTLWASGRSTTYYGQFRHWWRATEPISQVRKLEYNGKTGPSLARGEVLNLTLDLPDDLFDGSYVLRIDSSVQEGRDVPSDAVVPLRTEMSGVPVEGRGYVATVQIDM